METEALLLLQKPTGESTVRLTFFAPLHGHLTVYKRTGKTLSPRAQPDLFDTATLHLQASNDGKFHHLSSYHPSARRTRIPKDYPTFQAACQFATFLDKNIPWIEDTRRTYQLALTAFDALESHLAHPDIIRLKALYTLLKQEGYPVRQDWRAKIPCSEKPFLSSLLHTPLSELIQIPGHNVQPFLDNLLTWATHHTSFHFD